MSGERISDAKLATLLIQSLGLMGRNVIFVHVEVEIDERPELLGRGTEAFIQIRERRTVRSAGHPDRLLEK